jgi:predicted nucleic acid-binding protein
MRAPGILRQRDAQDSTAAKRSGSAGNRTQLRLLGSLSHHRRDRDPRIGIGEAWMLSLWDSMIVAAAEQSAATELLTEDLNHGQIVAGIRIHNPFIPD